jgi:hypothetical protein
MHEKRLAVGVESTYGAIGTTARFVACESTFDYKRDGVLRSFVGKDRMDGGQLYKREGVLTPNITLSAEPDNCGEIMAAFFGTRSVASAGAGAYKHTFVPAGTVSDSFASLCAKIDYGQGLVLDYTGLRGNSLTIDFKPKEDIKFSMDFIGKNEAAGTRWTEGTYGSYQPWIFSQVTMTFSGTQLAPFNMSFTANNALSEGFRVGTDYNTTRPLPSEKLKAELKFDVEYAAWIRNCYLGGSHVPVSVRVQGDTIAGTAKTELYLKLPRCGVQVAPYTNVDGLECLSVSCMVLQGTDGIGTGNIILELQNGVAAY